MTLSFYRWPVPFITKKYENPVRGRFEMHPPVLVLGMLVLIVAPVASMVPFAKVMARRMTVVSLPPFVLICPLLVAQIPMPRCPFEGLLEAPQ